MPETKWYSYLFSGISGLGIITNFKSFKYITRTFQTTDDLFSILAKDSLISTLCSGLYFITNTIRIITPEYLKNKPGCIVQFLGIYIPGVIGPAISSYISLHRYVALKNQKQISYPWLGSMVIMLVMLYHLTIIFLFTYTEMRNFGFIEACLGNPDPETHFAKSNIPVGCLVLAPMLIQLVATIVLDIFNYKMATHVAPVPSGMVIVSSEEQKKRQRIPARVTLINTCIFFIWLVVTKICLSGFGQDLIGALFWIDLIFLILNGIRNPIIVAFAFNANDQIKRETVEDRRQMEIKLALHKKARREASRADNSVRDQSQRNEDPKDEGVEVENISLGEVEIKVIEDTDIPGVIRVKEWNPSPKEH